MSTQSAAVANASQSNRCPASPYVSVRLLCRAAQWAQRRSAVHTHADLERTTNEDNYRTWRYHELEQQLTDHFDTNRIAHGDVLDFGCGTGELCTLLTAHNPKAIIGIDKCADVIKRAAATINVMILSETCRPKFTCNEQHDRLPLESESIDIVCCFDVLEHIPDVRAVACEWRRVLRPGGRVWIWWSPWRGPYGHHLESLVPLPWVHLLFSERTLYAACAELYDDPDFVPRVWDRDPVTGRKKPNKWQHTQSFHPFLNRLSRRQFESITRDAGLTIERREIHGFSGSQLRKVTRAFVPVPLLGDCFVSYYIYELTKR